MGMDSLPSHLLHLSLLQLLTSSSQFSHSKQVPLHLLTDLVKDYLHLLATTAKSHAERSGRTNVSVWDVGLALEEFGEGVDGLREESKRRYGEEGEGNEEGWEQVERLKELARDSLQDLVPSTSSTHTPLIRLSYNPLTNTEQSSLSVFLSQLPPPPSTSSDDASSDDSPSTPPLRLSPSKDRIRIKSEYEEEAEGLLPSLLFREEDPSSLQVEEEEEVAVPQSQWKDLSSIPAYIPEFLPPFPGMEREKDNEKSRRRERERELAMREREGGATYGGGGGGGVNPWVQAIPYNSSTIFDQHPVPDLPPIILPPPSNSTSTSTHERATSKRRRRRPLSPVSAKSTSLPVYRHTASLLSTSSQPPTYLPINPTRRLYTHPISLSSDMSLASDTLFGSIPIPPSRSATLVPGFLPETGIPLIHPFNTSLPHTIASSIPSRPSPHTLLLAPPPHSRLPQTIPTLAQHLSKPASNNPHFLPLFNRLTRIGPPGPLGPKGEALNYEYVGNTSIVATNVEWPQHLHNGKLPIRDDHNGFGGATPSASGSGAAGGGGGEGGTGIKLKFGGGGRDRDPNRQGSASAQGSPAPWTPSAWHSTGTPAPSGSWANVGTPVWPNYATPGPSGLVTPGVGTTNSFFGEEGTAGTTGGTGSMTGMELPALPQIEDSSQEEEVGAVNGNGVRPEVGRSGMPDFGTNTGMDLSWGGA